MALSRDDRPPRSTVARRRARLGLRRGAVGLAAGLRRLGLAGVAFRAYERIASLGSRPADAAPANGLPVPPPHLRVLVAGGKDRRAFLSSGEHAAASIRDMAAASGRPLGDLEAVLDFGVGCGRIARHWPEGPEWHACDHDERLVSWCVSNLPHLTLRRNAIAPPTGYADASFDFIYAISVFTHLDEQLQHQWLAEMRRLLRPDGRLLFTTHGDRFRAWLGKGQAQRFDRGELVVRFPEHQGSNLCSAFHPREWVREHLGPSMTSLEFAAAGAPGLGQQDVWIVHR